MQKQIVNRIAKQIANRIANAAFEGSILREKFI